MKKLLVFSFLILVCCTSSKIEDQEVKKDTIQNNSTAVVDNDIKQLGDRRKELEKIGYNYSNKIISKEKIPYEGKDLTFVQDLLDSANQVKGKMFVEQLSDSTFKRLYILDENELKYFISDNIFTNKIDTLEYGNPNNDVLYCSLRYKYYFTVYFPGGDPFTIQYIDSRKRFDNKYWDAP